MQLLERDAVPELHDEAAAGRVAVDVAEPVGDDEHASAEGRPESAGGVLRDGLETEGARRGQLGISRRQPVEPDVGAESFPGLAIEGERALAEPDARAEGPAATAARDQERRQRTQRVEREAEQLAGVAGAEGEARHGVTILTDPPPPTIRELLE